MPKKIGNTQLYNVDEVADVIGKGRNTTLALIREGKISIEKFGRKYYVSRSNLIDYLSEINLPPSTIEYRLGLKSPKNGKPIINKGE